MPYSNVSPALKPMVTSSETDLHGTVGNACGSNSGSGNLARPLTMPSLVTPAYTAAVSTRNILHFVAFLFS